MPLFHRSINCNTVADVIQLYNSNTPQPYALCNFVWVKDTTHSWLPAQITRTNAPDTGLFVHYLGFISKWDEWIDADSNRLAKIGAKDQFEQNLKLSSDILVRFGDPTKPIQQALGCVAVPFSIDIFMFDWSKVSSFSNGSFDSRTQCFTGNICLTQVENPLLGKGAYSGQVVDNLFEGKGEFVSSRGGVTADAPDKIIHRYKGDWHKDVATGEHAEIMYFNGNSYQGGVKDYTPCGFGVMKFDPNYNKIVKSISGTWSSINIYPKLHRNKLVQIEFIDGTVYLGEITGCLKNQDSIYSLVFDYPSLPGVTFHGAGITADAHENLSIGMMSLGKLHGGSGITRFHNGDLMYGTFADNQLEGKGACLKANRRLDKIFFSDHWCKTANLQEGVLIDVQSEEHQLLLAIITLALDRCLDGCFKPDTTDLFSSFKLKHSSLVGLLEEIVELTQMNPQLTQLPCSQADQKYKDAEMEPQQQNSIKLPVLFNREQRIWYVNNPDDFTQLIDLCSNLLDLKEKIAAPINPSEPCDYEEILFRKQQLQEQVHLQEEQLSKLIAKYKSCAAIKNLEKQMESKTNEVIKVEQI